MSDRQWLASYVCSLLACWMYRVDGGFWLNVVADIPVSVLAFSAAYLLIDACRYRAP